VISQSLASSAKSAICKWLPSELLKWPKTKKRDKAVQLVANAHTGIGKMVEAKKAFEAAAKDARVWIPYRGP